MQQINIRRRRTIADAKLEQVIAAPQIQRSLTSRTLSGKQSTGNLFLDRGLLVVMISLNSVPHNQGGSDSSPKTTRPFAFTMHVIFARVLFGSLKSLNRISHVSGTGIHPTRRTSSSRHRADDRLHDVSQIHGLRETQLFPARARRFRTSR